MKKIAGTRTSVGVWVGRLVGIFSLCIALLGAFLLLFPYPLNDRVTIVFATNPLQILTVNTIDHTAVLLQIPEDLAIEGAYAMGRYPIASFWKMGFLDARDHYMLVRSIEHSFGVPVDGFVGNSYEQLIENHEPIPLLRDTFSLQGVMLLATGRHVTNISLFKLFALRKEIAAIRQSDIKILDVGKSMSAYEEELPDGSTRFVLDPQRVDILIKNLFVIESVRKEAISVSVVNTTSVPDLAGSIARRLTNSGVYVVSVNSEEPPRKQCDISGKEETLKTKTAVFIADLLHCSKTPTSTQQREDLLVRLGTDIGDVYSPREAIGRSK